MAESASKGPTAKPTPPGDRVRAESTTFRDWLPDVARLVLGIGLTISIVLLLWEGLLQLAPAPSRGLELFHFARIVSSAAAVAVVTAWMIHRRGRRELSALRAEAMGIERDLAYHRVLLDAVVERAPAGLFVMDQSRTILTANEKAEKIHGARDIIGTRCFESFASPPEHCRACPALKTLRTGFVEGPSGYTTLPQTGETIVREAYPLSLPLKGSCVLVIDNVVTEQQKLQASLLHQEKMAAFGILAAGIAHELGNPLSSIHMHLQLLDGAELPHDAGSSIDFVRQEVERLQRSLRELVNFARRRRTEAALVSVQSVVADTLHLLRYDRRMRKVEASFDVDPDTAAVHIVEDHLMQVVLNLMLNALDAMPDGGRLRADLRSVGKIVSLRIHDDGIGMDSEVQARCFEPMFSTKDPGKGTGLGLSISRNILEAYGGDLELHSSPGRGTTAIVRLPAAEQAREVEAADVESGVAAARSVATESLPV